MSRLEPLNRSVLTGFELNGLDQKNLGLNEPKKLRTLILSDFGLNGPKQTKSQIINFI